MQARLARALRSGVRAALVALFVQSTAAVALAAALPEVGHLHPDGAPAHAHALVEVGGLGTAASPTPALPRPVRAPRSAMPPRRAAAPRSRDRRTRLGRDPPWAPGSALAA